MSASRAAASVRVPERRACFGIETEYAVSAVRTGGHVVSPSTVAGLFARRAAARRHLSGSESGIWLSSGARWYVDIGGHPEYASPESLSPWDGAKYDLAGDVLMSQLAREIAEEHPHLRVLLRKGNVDYTSDGVTWASHENFLCRLGSAVLGPRLVPHLVSRVVFTGGGGLNPVRSSEPVFVLSPRAMFARSALFEPSAGRPLVDGRDESLCKGYRRQHLTCGDSLRGHLGAFLRLATTAIVIKLIEADRDGDEDVHLARPMAALQIVAHDTSLRRRLRLGAGGFTTALDIQRHYLTRARQNLDVLPEWAPAACDIWADTLERLSSGGVDGVSDRLDWAIKYAIYRDRAARRGVRWPASRSVAAPGPSDPAAARAAADWRAELCELDTRFAQLHPPGLFDELDAAGVLRHHVPGITDIEHAVTTPPAQGRARVRGAVIARLAADSQEWTCSWSRIGDALQISSLDLSDPFVEDERWTNRLHDPRIGFAARMLRLTRSEGDPAPGPTIRECAERIAEPDAGDLRRCLARFAPELNYRGVRLRRRGRLEDAEWLIRTALAIDVEAGSDPTRLIPHRRGNVASVLLLQDRVDEAVKQLSLAWSAIEGCYNVTTARLLALRLAAALLRGEPPAFFVGQLKSHLALDPLPLYPPLDARSGTGEVFQSLAHRLRNKDRALLVQVMAVLNSDESVDSLDRYGRWRRTHAVPLDAPWPEPDSGDSPSRGLEISVG